MNIKDNQGVATQVYEEIKRRIIQAVYPPGGKLSEARLVDELGCGRSPIRTAFARLQGEGFIAVSPQSGTYVRALTEPEIRDIFECRLLLETHVTRFAALRMDAEQLRRLRVAFRRLAPRGADDVTLDLIEDFNELDAMFHMAIYKVSGNEVITGILLNLHEKAQWLKHTNPSPPERMHRAFREIELVLESLEERDPDEAERRMRAHIGNAEDYGASSRGAENMHRSDASPPQKVA